MRRKRLIVLENKALGTIIWGGCRWEFGKFTHGPA
jgi:hypothetical protein